MPMFRRLRLRTLQEMLAFPHSAAVEAALAELTTPTRADTTQFFGPHPLELEHGLPRVHAVLAKDALFEVYFKPASEHYFLVLMVEHQGGTWTIRGCRPEARSRVALSLVSDELTAGDITQAIGLEPTDSWSTGDLRPRNMQHLGTYRFTRWTLCLEGDLPGEFEDKLTRLLDVTDHASSRIRALGSVCDINILVGYQGYAQQMWGLPIEARDMARIAALGAGLDVDLYASGPELGRPHEAPDEQVHITQPEGGAR